MKPTTLHFLTCLLLLLVLSRETLHAQGRRGPGAPNVPVTPAFYPIPVQNYVLLDVSGDDPVYNPVGGIGLRDDNQVAFSVFKGDPIDILGGTVSVTKWLNGTFTAGETLKTREVVLVWSGTYQMMLSHTIYRDTSANLTGLTH